MSGKHFKTFCNRKLKQAFLIGKEMLNHPCFGLFSSDKCLMHKAGETVFRKALSGKTPQRRQLLTDCQSVCLYMFCQVGGKAEKRAYGSVVDSHLLKDLHNSSNFSLGKLK
jgi:hypothetical protein